jgi:DNA-binding NarL/FixJ family response regulator
MNELHLLCNSVERE